MSSTWQNIGWDSRINWNDGKSWNNVDELERNREAHVHALYLEMVDEKDPERRLELFHEMADVAQGKK